LIGTRWIGGTRARHGVGERLADVGKEDGRAVDRDDLLQMLGRNAADSEKARLRRLDEEQRLVADLRRQRDGQHRFVDVRLDLLAARAEADLDLRLFLHENDCGDPGFSRDKSLR
jgi:hypothetical protein